MDIKIHVQVIVASIVCFGLLMVALYCYIMLIGPIREMFTDETVFTETYQKINGNVDKV